MTSKDSCQFKYQKPFLSAFKPLISTIESLATPKRMLLASALASLLVSGCQSTTTNDLTGSTPYQTSTRPTSDRNLDQQEIARVRTSLAAQYIRKNELDTAQRQLKKPLLRIAVTRQPMI